MGKGKFIVVIVIVFVAALAVGGLVQLWIDPDFAGFRKPEDVHLEVTYIEGAASESGSGEVAAPAYEWSDHPVLVVGDSLTQGARKEIGKALPDATIDGKVNRNMSQGLSILQNWDTSGLIADDAIIVVCLANNITDSTLKDAQAVIDMIKPGQALVMMTGHGRSNMTPANEFIRGLPNEYSFITVADWDLTIAQSLALLGEDGIHINGTRGNTLYADLIVKALEQTQPME